MEANMIIMYLTSYVILLPIQPIHYQIKRII